MEEVTFARNFSNLKRSESDILVMCTDRAPKNSIWAPTKKFTKNGLPVIYFFGSMHDFYIK